MSICENCQGNAKGGGGPYPPGRCQGCGGRMIPVFDGPDEAAESIPGTAWWRFWEVFTGWRK